jgi:hypothetical protein
MWITKHFTKQPKAVLGVGIEQVICCVGNKLINKNKNISYGIF